MILIPFFLLGCTIASPSGAPAADTGSAPDTGDTAAETGTPEDTGECPKEGTVVVHLQQYELARGCWEWVDLTVNAAYWWEYAECPTESYDCGDMAWRLADGDTCLLLPQYCEQVWPNEDPDVSATPEQEAWCGALPATPACP